MPVFPTRAWFEEAIRLANEDPDAARAGFGWEGDIAALATAEEGKLPHDVLIHLRPEGGRLTGFQMFEDRKALDGLKPAYVARGSYSAWKGLLTGTLDPIEAIVLRRIVLSGDVQQLVERARFKDFIGRVLSRVPTTFIDDSTGE